MSASVRSMLAGSVIVLLSSTAPPARAQAIPEGPLGDAIRRGEQIGTRTTVYARNYVRARMNCTSCHLEGGRQRDAAPWTGIWGSFPAYSDRSSSIETKMRLGQGGTLDDQEAYDVAAYFTREPRPDFPGKVRDWAKGGKPADARY